MTPELKYVNQNIEVSIFGKSLSNIITEKVPEKQILQQKEFLSEFYQIPQERIFILEQVHGFDCIRITEQDIEHNKKLLYHKADAMITNLKNVILCIRTADCLPLFLHTNPYKELKYIGIIHAGWRGIYRGIIPNTFQLIIQTMEKHFFEFKMQKKENYKELLDYPITIFPGIYIPEELYVVDNDVANLFPMVKKNSNNGKYNLDLWKNILYQLQSLKNFSQFAIEDPFSYLNSYQMEIFENFYSHRKGDNLRNLNVIYIKQED